MNFKSNMKNHAKLRLKACGGCVTKGVVGVGGVAGPETCDNNS